MNSYWEAGIYWFERFVRDDVIPETQADMRRFTLPSCKSPTEYVETLWNKVLRCARLYDKYVLSAVLIEGLPAAIRFSMPPYWCSKRQVLYFSEKGYRTRLGVQCNFVYEMTTWFEQCRDILSSLPDGYPTGNYWTLNG